MEVLNKGHFSEVARSPSHNIHPQTQLNNSKIHEKQDSQVVTTTWLLIFIIILLHITTVVVSFWTGLVGAVADVIYLKRRKHSNWVDSAYFFGLVPVLFHSEEGGK